MLNRSSDEGAPSWLSAPNGSREPPGFSSSLGPAGGADGTTVPWPPGSSRPPGYEALLTMLMAALALITVAGNSLVILAFATDRGLRTHANFFFLNLALADLLVGGFCMPLYAPYVLTGEWRLGRGLCKLWLVMDYLLCTASVFNIVLISFDRFLSVTKAVTYRAQQCMTRRAVLKMLTVWLAAFLLYGPAIIAWEYAAGASVVPPGECYVEFYYDWRFLVAASALEFVAPLVSVTYFNLMIYSSIRRRHATLKPAVSCPRRAGERPPDGGHRCAGGDDTGAVFFVRESPAAQRAQVLAAGPFPRERARRGDAGAGDWPPKVQSRGKERAAKEVSFSLAQTRRGTMHARRAEERPSTSSSVSATVAHLGTRRAASRGAVRSGVVAPCPNRGEALSRRRVLEKNGERLVCTGGCTGGPHGDQSKYGAAAGAPSQQPPDARLRLSRDKRVAKSLAIIVCVFVTCWAPYTLLMIVRAACRGQCVDDRLTEFSIWLLWLNSAVNPALYPLCHVRFKRAFVRILCQCKCTVDPRAVPCLRCRVR